jgi:hypothetical protein
MADLLKDLVRRPGSGHCQYAVMLAVILVRSRTLRLIGSMPIPPSPAPLVQLITARVPIAKPHSGFPVCA